MKRVLLTIMAACLLAFTASADLGAPGTVETEITGVSVDAAPVCFANDLGEESKALFALWADLLAKLEAGTLTDEEGMQGSFLSQTQTCMQMAAGIAGTVVLLDGHDYLVDYCLEGYDCIRVIQKSDGFAEDL